MESGLRDSDVIVTLVDSDESSKPNFYFEFGAALAMGKQIIPIVPRDYDTRALPLSVRRRRYLIQDTPEHTAEQLSKSLLAA
jgi:hypothetical protein